MTKSRPTSRIKNHFFIIGAIFVLAILSWRFLPAPGEWLSETIFSPLLSGESALNRVFSSPAEDLNLEEQTELNYLRAENTSLREVLGVDEETRVAAGVIGRPTALPYDVLVIDRGSNDGVMEYAPVYAGEQNVIGFVAGVFEKSAVVALVSTPGFTSTVYIYGSNIYTTAVGMGGGVTRINVPQGVPLTVGDIVVAPSLSPGIYGIISAVNSVPELPQQYGYVTTEKAINSLRAVSVGSRPLSVIDFEAAREVVEKARLDFLTVNVPTGVLIDVESATTSATSTLETATSTSDEVTEETP
jgi:cell shape-determining protein MreC